MNRKKITCLASSLYFASKCFGVYAVRLYAFYFKIDFQVIGFFWRFANETLQRERKMKNKEINVLTIAHNGVRCK